MNFSELNALPDLGQNKSLFEIVITTKTYSLFLIIIPLLTIFGNGLVILAVFRERALQTVTNMLIVSLAVSDMLIGTFVMTFAVYFEWTDFRWNLGAKLCNFYLAVDVACSTASILNLFAISLDRYIAISHPILYTQQFGFRSNRALISIFLVWFISIGVAIPILFGANPLENQQCEFTSAYFIIGSSLFSFFLPCAAMIILYTIIFYRLKQRDKARCLRHSVPVKNQVENENISVALFSGARVAEHVGKYLKRQADQLFFEYSYPTSTYPTLSGSSSLETLPIIGRGKQQDSSELASMPNVSLPNTSSLEPVTADNPECKVLIRSSSTPTMPTTKISETPRCFGDQFIDTFPYIDSLSQDTISFIKTKEKAETIEIIKSTSHEQLDEKLFRDLIRNYNPPFLLKKKSHLLNRSGTDRPKGKQLESDFDTFSLPITPLEPPKVSRRNKTTVQITENHTTPNTDHSSIMSTSLLFAVFHSFWRTHAIESRSSITKPNCFDRLIQSNFVRRLFGGIHLNAKPSKQVIKRASRQLRREQRVTVTLVIVLAVFLGCWVPFFSFHLANALCIIIYTNHCVNFLATFLTTWLGYLNSCLNPIIYTVFDHRFRRAFKSILHLGK